MLLQISHLTPSYSRVECTGLGVLLPRKSTQRSWRCFERRATWTSKARRESGGCRSRTARRWSWRSCSWVCSRPRRRSRRESTGHGRLQLALRISRNNSCQRLAPSINALCRSGFSSCLGTILAYVQSTQNKKATDSVCHLTCNISWHSNRRSFEGSQRIVCGSKGI